MSILHACSERVSELQVAQFRLTMSTGSYRDLEGGSLAQEPKRLTKPKNRTNSTKEFSEQFEGITGSLASEARGLRQTKKIAPESSPEHSEHKILGAQFRCGTFSVPHFRRVPPCAVKTCAVRPVFARVVGELWVADPSSVQGRVKQNASAGQQSEAPGPRWKPGQEQNPGPENQDSQHMLEQPRGYFPDTCNLGSILSNP